MDVFLSLEEITLFSVSLNSDPLTGGQTDSGGGHGPIGPLATLKTAAAYITEDKLHSAHIS